MESAIESMPRFQLLLYRYKNTISASIESFRIETFPILSHGKLPIVSCNCNIIIRRVASDNGKMFLTTVWGPKPMKVCFYLTGNCQPTNSYSNPWEFVNPAAFLSESDGVISWLNFVTTYHNNRHVLAWNITKYHHMSWKITMLNRLFTFPRQLISHTLGLN